MAGRSAWARHWDQMEYHLSCNSRYSAASLTFQVAFPYQDPVQSPIFELIMLLSVCDKKPLALIEWEFTKAGSVAHSASAWAA